MFFPLFGNSKGISFGKKDKNTKDYDRCDESFVC